MAGAKFLRALAVVDTITSELADTNKVELAWFTRGAIDALGEVVATSTNTKTHTFTDAAGESGEYTKFYSAGYRSVKGASRKVGLT